MALMLTLALASALIMVAATPLRATMPCPTAASTQQLGMTWMADTRPAEIESANLRRGEENRARGASWRGHGRRARCERGGAKGSCQPVGRRWRFAEARR